MPACGRDDAFLFIGSGFGLGLALDTAFAFGDAFFLGDALSFAAALPRTRRSGVVVIGVPGVWGQAAGLRVDFGLLTFPDLELHSDSNLIMSLPKA